MYEEIDIVAHMGLCLKNMRGSKTQKQAAAECKVDVRTIRNIETGKKTPRADTLAFMLMAYRPSIDELIELFRLGDFMTEDAAYDISTAHKNRLARFENHGYYCYFFNNKKNNDDLEELIIEPFKYKDRGFSAASAFTDGYQYHCKLTCSKSGLYSFMSFTSSDDLCDKAYFMIPLNRRAKDTYHAGVGVMLSLVESDNNTDAPCFQKVCVISQEYIDIIGTDEVKAICKEKLKLQFKGDQRVRVDGIQTTSDKLYNELHIKIKE